MPDRIFITVYKYSIMCLLSDEVVQCIQFATSRRNRAPPDEGNNQYGFLLELPIDLQSFLSDTSSHILPREIINEK